MTRATLLLVLLFLAAPYAVPGAGATELNLGLYVLGVPVADAVLSIDLSSAAYRVGLRYHTTGLVDLVNSDSLDARVRGNFERDLPAPFDYAASGRLRGQDRSVALTWRDGTPVATQITPPNAGEREDVPDALRMHAVDPLSSIVQLLHQATATGHCDGASRSYDGRRLQLFDSRTIGEEEVPPSRHSVFSGLGLRCDFTDRTIAGYRYGAGRDADMRPRRGTIWLARLTPGAQFLPVRASIETLWLGDAMIYLTRMAP